MYDSTTIASQDEVSINRLAGSELVAGRCSAAQHKLHLFVSPIKDQVSLQYSPFVLRLVLRLASISVMHSTSINLLEQ